MLICTINIFAFSQTTQKWKLNKTNTLAETNFSLTYKKGVPFFTQSFYDGSNGTEKMVAKKNGKIVILNYAGGGYNGEYFKVEVNGNLGLYNKDKKKFGEAKKM
jgi:hypothetical protein